MHTVLITGAAGYVGTMLVREYAKRDDVLKVIGLDKEPMPELLKDTPKLVWITSNVINGAHPDLAYAEGTLVPHDTWQGTVADMHPDIVIHTAWQIREMYGQRPLQWKWNVDGSDAVFKFAFETPSVAKLVYFSTASSYGAYVTNKLEHRFKEEEGFRKEEYLYAVEKKETEDRLLTEYARHVKQGGHTAVAVVRPAAITGPRGRYMRVRFGLQSALSGQLKESLIHRLVSLMVSWVPATPLWCRQFIHEDDVVDIVTLLAFTPGKDAYEVYNITPPGEPVLAPEMASAVGKRVLPIKPWMVRIAFAFFWHATRGKIPTSKGGWRFYSYPIVMDGTKLSRERGYQYTYRSGDAFRYTDGRYETFVPEAQRKHKK